MQGIASTTRSDFDLGLPFGLGPDAQQHTSLDADSTLWHGRLPSAVNMGMTNGLGSHAFADEEHSLSMSRHAGHLGHSHTGTQAVQPAHSAQPAPSAQAARAQQDYTSAVSRAHHPLATSGLGDLVPSSAIAAYPRFARAGSVSHVDMSDGTGGQALYATSVASAAAAAIGLSPLLQAGGMSALAAPPAMHPSVELSSAQSRSTMSRTRGGKSSAAAAAGATASGGRPIASKSPAAAEESSADDNSTAGSKGRGRGGGRGKSGGQASARAESKADGKSVPSRQPAPSPPASEMDSNSAPPSEGASEGGGKSKKRFLWTEDLHKRFVSSIFDFGLKNATPKILYELMQPGPAEMTSDHIKSHLQKFRNNSAVGREMFLKDFEQARADAEARAEELMRTSGQVPFPTHFSTYPVSMHTGGSGGEMADDSAAHGNPCARCERFSNLILLGVGLPESEADMTTLTKEAQSMVQAYATAASAGTHASAPSGPSAQRSYPVSAAAGSGSSTASSTHSSHTPSAFPAYREQMQAGIQQALAMQSQQISGTSAGAAASAQVQSSDPNAATNQLLHLLRQYVTQHLQAQAPGSASAIPQPMPVPAASVPSAASHGWPTMPSSLSSSAASSLPAMALSGQPQVAAVLQQVTAAAASAQPAGGKPVSYADLLRLVRAGQADAASLAHAAPPRAGADLQHLTPTTSVPPPPVQAAGANIAAAPGDAFAAMARAMAAQMRMHRAMMHRQEGQLQTYGQEAARTANQQGTPGSDGSGPDKPVRKGSMSSDDSGGNGAAALGPVLDAGLVAAYEAPVSVGEIHAAHAKDAVGGIKALFEQRFSLGVLDTLTGNAPRASVQITLASGRQVRLPSAAVTATGLAGVPSTAAHTGAGGEASRADALAPAHLFSFLSATTARVPTV